MPWIAIAYFIGYSAEAVVSGKYSSGLFSAPYLTDVIQSKACRGQKVSLDCTGAHRTFPDFQRIFYDDVSVE